MQIFKVSWANITTFEIIMKNFKCLKCAMYIISTSYFVHYSNWVVLLQIIGINPPTERFLQENCLRKMTFDFPTIDFNEPLGALVVMR